MHLTIGLDIAGRILYIQSMRIKVFTNSAHLTSVQIGMQKKNQELIRFTAGQLMALRKKKLGLAVHLGS